MMDHAFFQERMILYQQGMPGQVISHSPHDQPDEETGNPEFKRHQLKMFMQCSRHHHLVKVYPVTEDDEHRHDGDHGPVPFGSPPHQYQQRAKEVHDQVEEEEAFIRACFFCRSYPLNKILGLFRLVTVPDQHILGEPQVCPEH